MFGEIMPTLDDRPHDAPRYMHILRIKSPKVRNHPYIDIICTSSLNLIINVVFDIIYFFI